MNRKNMKYWILPLVGLVMLQSCFKNDEEYWDESASIRLENTIQDYRSVLVNSEYGWVMDFYPDQTYTEGGYVYTMKFENDGNVAVGYELANPTDTRTSMYSIGGGEGPVLTFDTYNEFMHHFGTPDIVNYEGLGGDYEFVLQRRSDAGDYVKTLGRKSKNHMPMYKLTMPASDYYAAVDEMKDMILNPYILVSAGETSYSFAKESSVAAYIDEDEDIYPFVYTNEGLRFCYGMGDVNAKDSVFVLSENKDQLIGVNNPNVVITGDNFGLYLQTAGTDKLVFTFTDMPQAWQDFCNKLNQQLVAYDANYPLGRVGLSFDSSWNMYCLYVEAGNRKLTYGLNVEAPSGTNQLVISKMENQLTNSNCDIYIGQGVTAIAELAEAICGEYTFSSPNTLTYQDVALTSGEIDVKCTKESSL